MSYEQKISTQKPGLVVLLLDDSGSMKENLAGTSDPRYKWTERYAGYILKELLDRSSDMKGDNLVVKPRYCIHVIKYGSRTELWGNPEMEIQSAVELYSRSGNSLGLGGHLQGTNARAAFEQALNYLNKAVASERFNNSFPPMVLHLTDGESHTDAKPVADQIRQLSTTDGNVLVVNAYIGTQTSLNYNNPEEFPGYLDVSEAGPSVDNIRLFEMSSQVPKCIEENLKADGIFPNLRSGSRLFFDVRTKEMLKNVFQLIGSLGSRMVR